MKCLTLDGYVIGDGLRIIEKPSSELMEEVYRLRVIAWSPQARLRRGTIRWADQYDSCGQHWVIVHGVSPVAAIRLTLHDSAADLPAASAFNGLLPADLKPPLASYNRLVVHPEYRGRGLAKVLDLVCIDAARHAGATALLGLTGNVPGNRSRIPAMQALGFQVLGVATEPDVDIIEEDGLSTALMLDLRSPQCR
jgi:GNAT superfamily N-acetyltransferase